MIELIRNFLWPELPEEGGYYANIYYVSPGGANLSSPSGKGMLFAVYQYRGGRRGNFYTDDSKAPAFTRHVGWQKGMYHMNDTQVMTWKLTGRLVGFDE